MYRTLILGSIIGFLTLTFTLTSCQSGRPKEKETSNTAHTSITKTNHNVSTPYQTKSSIKVGPKVQAITSPDQTIKATDIELLLKNYGSRGSLLQRTVGHAEGTRNVDGKIGWAYWGHQDPMCVYITCRSKITNLGSFSFQQASDKPIVRTPLQADLIQQQVLRLQALELLYQAQSVGLQLNVFQLLAGVDLANQSPTAACVMQPNKSLLNKLAAGISVDSNTKKALAQATTQNRCRWGYIDRLKQSIKQKKLEGFDAVVEARAWSFFDVNPYSRRYNKWNASGLGHSPTIIDRDQRRRTKAVADGLRYQLENPKEFTDIKK
jgi:hypothetical protein